MEKSFCILVFAFLFFNLYSQSNADWILIGEPTATSLKMYIKSDIVKKDEEGIKIWTKQIYNTLKENNKTYLNAYILRLIVVNCDEKQIKILKKVSYKSDNTKISSSDYEYADWEDIVPESLGEATMKKLCAAAPVQKESYTGVFHYTSFINTLKEKKGSGDWGEDEVFQIQNDITIDLDNKKITIYTGSNLLYDIDITRKLETHKSKEFEDHTYEGVDKKNHPCDISLTYDLKEGKMFFLRITNLKGSHTFFL